jgi:hypothetical protein
MVYGLFLKSIAEGRINFSNDSFKAMLCTAAYSPSQSGHQFKASVVGEVQGSGYTPGGASLLIGSITYANKQIAVKASNLSWPMVTLKDIRYLVVYDDTPPVDAAKPLVLWVDFLTKQSPTNQSLYYNWPNGDLLKLEVP